MWSKKLTLFKNYLWLSFIKSDSWMKKQLKYKIFVIKAAV